MSTGTGITGKGAKKNNYIAKDLMPGLVEARIIGLAVVKKEKIFNKEGYPEYEVQISLEGRAPEDKEFVGWQKDPNDPSKGNYKGPFKLIKHGTWPIKMFKFTSKKTDKEVTVTAEEQILAIMQEIAEAFNKPNLFDQKEYQKEFATWKDYIKQMNQDLQFAKNYIWWCLAGTKTKNKQGYITYFLNLPERKLCQNKPRIASKKENLCEYDETSMIFINQKSFDEHSATATKTNDHDEEFSTEEVNEVEFGNTDAGTTETLFEGADEFDVDFENAPLDEDF